MRYRAILNDPGRPAERPTQTFAETMDQIEDWVISTLVGRDELQGTAKVDTSDQATVTVYETKEVQLHPSFTRQTAKHLRWKRRERNHPAQDPESFL